MSVSFSYMQLRYLRALTIEFNGLWKFLKGLLNTFFLTGNQDIAAWIQYLMLSRSLGR